MRGIDAETLVADWIAWSAVDLDSCLVDILESLVSERISKGNSSLAIED